MGLLLLLLAICLTDPRQGLLPQSSVAFQDLILNMEAIPANASSVATSSVTCVDYVTVLCLCFLLCETETLELAHYPQDY